MATTTNFGWQTPDDTDLVKDGAAAIRTLGSSIDTSLVDLKGGTTDQVLAKNSNTDMDFKWVTSDDANAIQNAIVDAKGDLITATAADTPARLASSGVNGDVLQVDTSTATGLKWATPTASSPLTTKGDLYTYSTTNDRLAAGNNGETLLADSSQTTGLRWGNNLGFTAGKNKIINGNMAIDQRNAGAAVTVNAQAFVYPVDRFSGLGELTDGVFTLQQDSDAPAGFSKSLKATVTTADASIGSSQSYNLRTQLEGGTVADLNYGTANAQTVTLSFYVRSSLTGTFGGSLRNSAVNRSYPFSYTINSANTWERKTITITGDTSGTWLTDTGIGLRILWSFGTGSNFLGTAGSWAGANYISATGETALIGTLNATWYITGVQLERGSTATAFQTATGTLQGELSLAQRYFERFANDGGATGSALAIGFTDTTTTGLFPLPFTEKRVTPTFTFSAASGFQVNTAAATAISSGRPSKKFVRIDTTGSGYTANVPANLRFVDSTTATIDISAEL